MWLVLRECFVKAETQQSDTQADSECVWGVVSNKWKGYLQSNKYNRTVKMSFITFHIRPTTKKCWLWKISYATFGLSVVNHVAIPRVHNSRLRLFFNLRSWMPVIFFCNNWRPIYQGIKTCNTKRKFSKPSAHFHLVTWHVLDTAIVVHLLSAGCWDDFKVRCNVFSLLTPD